MAHSSGFDRELESKICEMSYYLDNLIVGEEKDCHFDPNSPSCSGTATDFKRRTPPLSYIPSLVPTTNPVNLFQQNTPMSSSRFPLNNVTSALATRITAAYSSTLRFAHPVSHPKARKWGNYKQVPAKEPDTSDINISDTMHELGITPQSLTSNTVRQLFSKYKTLAFYLHAEYIFEDIYESKTLPNTMNVTVQTRHAIWSSNKLLRQLRDMLKEYAEVPSLYEKAIAECEQSVEELHVAILKLETFKYCALEHRKGVFISTEARENAEPLIDALNNLINCVGVCRMYFQVIEWAFKVRQPAIDVVTESSRAGPSQPATEDETLEPTKEGRPVAARRYIG